MIPVTLDLSSRKHLDLKWYSVAIDLKHGDEKSKITKEEQYLVGDSFSLKKVNSKNLFLLRKVIY